MNHCPQCRRRLQVQIPNPRIRYQKKCNIQQTLKNISLYDVIEEWSKKQLNPGFDFMEFLAEAIQKRELKENSPPPPTERKKWDLPKK